MEEQDNKQQEQETITQVQCLNCQCSKIQLISIKKLSETKTELNIICEVCGLLMVVGAGEIKEPQQKQSDKPPDYLG